eukprot:10435420-Alexandrium_andersonii.AAC.1
MYGCASTGVLGAERDSLPSQPRTQDAAVKQDVLTRFCDSLELRPCVQTRQCEAADQSETFKMQRARKASHGHMSVDQSRRRDRWLTTLKLLMGHGRLPHEGQVSGVGSASCASCAVMLLCLSCWCAPLGLRRRPGPVPGISPERSALSRQWDALKVPVPSKIPASVSVGLLADEYLFRAHRVEAFGAQ